MTEAELIEKHPKLEEYFSSYEDLEVGLIKKRKNIKNCGLLSFV